MGWNVFTVGKKIKIIPNKEKISNKTEVKNKRERKKGYQNKSENTVGFIYNMAEDQIRT